MKAPDIPSPKGGRLDEPTIPGMEGYSGIPSIGAAGLSAEVIASIQEKQQRTQERIEEQLSRLYSVSSGKNALDELVTKAGVDPKALVEFLWQIQVARSTKAKDLGAVPGVPLRAIRRLPQLLRKLSFQIEAINKHGYELNSNQLLMLMLVPRLRNMYMAGKKLPSFLRVYAYDISRRLSARQNRKKKKLEPATEAKVQLAEYIRKVSHDRKQHYKALETLINVFYQVERVTSRVTRGSMKALWSAHPELREQPKTTEAPPLTLLKPLSSRGVS